MLLKTGLFIPEHPLFSHSLLNVEEPHTSLFCILAVWCHFCSYKDHIFPRGLEGNILEPPPSNSLVGDVWLHDPHFLLLHLSVCDTPSSESSHQWLSRLMDNSSKSVFSAYMMCRVGLRRETRKLLHSNFSRCFLHSGQGLTCLQGTALLQNVQAELCQGQPKAQQLPHSCQWHLMSLLRIPESKWNLILKLLTAL